MPKSSSKVLNMVSKRIKIILMGAGFTTKNMGVWALASGAITSALRVHTDGKIFFLDYYLTEESYDVKTGNGSVSAQLLNLRYSKKFWLPNNIARLLLTALIIKFFPSQTLRNRFIGRNSLLRHIVTADVIGSIAGGDSFSDIYGIQRLIYVALPQILIILLGKPLVLLPQTLGPFKKAFTKFVAKNILKHAQKVYSRDYKSLKAARNLVGHDCSNLGFCYDMGFMLEPIIVKERIPSWLIEHNRDCTVVGLNVSGLLLMGGYTQKNMFMLKTDYCRLIHEIIELLVQKHRAHIMLVPHVYGEGRKSESDLIACKEVYYKSKQEIHPFLHLLEDNYDHHELKALIGRCDFFIGSRMHACIAALSQCIPAVALPTAGNFEEYLKQLKWKKW